MDSSCTDEYGSRNAYQDTLAMLNNTGKIMLPDWPASSQLFDPDSETWITVEPTLYQHDKPVTLSLSDGRVFCAGGNTNKTEIYDPISSHWYSTGDLSDNR